MKWKFWEESKPAVDISMIEKKDLPPITGGEQMIGVKERADDILKAYIPNFLYKPPFGYPRRVNVFALKQLSFNPYVFSVIKTMADEAASMPWDVKVKEDFQKDGNDYEPVLKKAKAFLRNPNGNEESIEFILRQVIWSLMEVDAGVIVKVFNLGGELSAIYARDGATFLKNPNIYGTMDERTDFVAPLPQDMAETHLTLYEEEGSRYKNKGEDNTFRNAQVAAAAGQAIAGVTQQESHKQMLKQYGVLYLQNAAYFQYGNFSASVPVPFGKRELIYIMQNPRYDSIYGQSPVEVLNTIILSLVYGSEHNLDYYSNSNMPEGVVQLLGAKQDQIAQFRKNWDAQFRFKDVFGKIRKRFFTFPLVSTEVKFTPFALSSKDMEVITSQEWFIKLVWMCFGVTPDEMGMTENSNRAISAEQTRVFKRKAIKPLLNVLKFHLDTQLLPEFCTNEAGELPMDCPIELVFKDYDHEEELNKHNILKMELDMGIKTKEMVAEELGIDWNEVKESKDRAMEEAQAMMPEVPVAPEEEQRLKEEGKPSFPAEEEIEKTTPTKSVPEQKGVLEEIGQPVKPPNKREIQSEMDKYIDDVEDSLMDALDRLSDRDVGNVQ